MFEVNQQMADDNTLHQWLFQSLCSISGLCIIVQYLLCICDIRPRHITVVTVREGLIVGKRWEHNTGQVASLSQARHTELDGHIGKIKRGTGTITSSAQLKASKCLLTDCFRVAHIKTKAASKGGIILGENTIETRPWNMHEKREEEENTKQRVVAWLAVDCFWD